MAALRLLDGNCRLNILSIKKGETARSLSFPLRYKVIRRDPNKCYYDASLRKLDITFCIFSRRIFKRVVLVNISIINLKSAVCCKYKRLKGNNNDADK